MADIDVDLTVVVTTPNFSASTATSSDDITGPTNADMFRSADVVENFTTIATSLNVPARAADREAVVLPYVVTNAGATLSGQLLNASLLAAYAHASSVRAAAIAQIGDVLTVRDQITPGPTAWAECGLGPDGYNTPDIDAARGYWKCDTLNPSPSTSMRIRVTARTLSGSDAAAGYQELHSEPGDSGGVSGEGGSADRFEYAVELAELMSDFFEWGDTPGEPEIGQSSVAGPPAGVWVEREMDLTFATGVLAFRVRSDLLFDYVDPDDGSTWITLRTFTHGPTSLAASNNAVEQWIGRGDGRFDVARVQKWHDGTLVMDADFTTATEGATEIDDAVLESAPGVPAVWEAQLNAVVGVPAASGGGGGAVDSVNGETGAVVLDAADVGVLRPEGPVTHSAANEAAMLALSAVRGDVCARVDLGQSLLYLTADDPTNAGNWATLRFGTEDPRARANHTGTQAQSTITDLATDLAGKVGTGDSRLSDTRTPTDASVTTAKLDATLSGRIPAIVRAASDETRSAAAAKADDPTLKFAAAANTFHRVEFHLTISGDSTADVAVGVSAPSGATMSFFMDYFGGAVAAASNVNQAGAHITTPGASGVVAGGVIASPGLAYRLTGWVQLSSTAGDVTLFWGPNSNGAGTGVTRHAGSHLIHYTP